MDKLRKRPATSNPSPRPAADPDGWATQPRWLWRELDWRGGLAANSLAALFALVSAGWYLSTLGLATFDVRPFLTEHFALTFDNLSAGRPYCYLTHAFLSVGSPVHTLLTLAGLVLTGYAAERRVGLVWVVAVFVVATVIGGAAELAAGTVSGHAAADDAIGWVKERAGPGAAGLTADAAARVLHARGAATGPAAAVAAFLALAVLVRPDDGTRWDNVWVALAATALIVAHSPAVLGTAAAGVVAASRTVGIGVGLAAALAWAIFARETRGPGRWPRRLAAAGLLALPFAGMAVATRPNEFAPGDFIETCFWLERAAWPITDETEAEVRPADRAAVEAAVAGVTNRPVAWALPPIRATGREVRLTSTYLVSVAWVDAVPPAGPEFAAYAGVRRTTGRRPGVGVVLHTAGREGVAVPLTPELMALAATQSPGDPVPVSATVERIEVVVPGPADPLHGLARCVFRVHLTGLAGRTGKPAGAAGM